MKVQSYEEWLAERERLLRELDDARELAMGVQPGEVDLSVRGVKAREAWLEEARRARRRGVEES